MKQKAVISIIIMVVIYLAISFVLWQIDASKWDTVIRGIYVFLAPIFSISLSNIILNSIEE
jgi:drug/metabolite transporter (DMT)-like permease